MKKYACILNYVINSMFEITIKKTYFIENVNLDKRVRMNMVFIGLPGQFLWIFLKL